MSSSIPNHKFLLDENVRLDLYKFLTSQGCDVKLAPKTGKDSIIASISKKDSRIIVTNDSDFQYFTEQQVFSVVFLNIPQYEGEILISSFIKLLSDFDNFPGRIVVLKPNTWEDFPLLKKIAKGIYQRGLD